MPDSRTSIAEDETDERTLARLADSAQTEYTEVLDILR
jgi:hypothetical protein